MSSRMDNKNKVSIIVPVYNEEQNIIELVKRTHTAMLQHGKEYEIIFIDDHSSDNTSKIIADLIPEFPIKYFKKIGKKGKAFSLEQGFAAAKYDVLCMIDADLQYSPEAIPIMADKLNKADIIVANRKKHKTSHFRKILSLGFRFVFGKMLFGLDADIQSGLKVFKKEVWLDIAYRPDTAWAFDLEFLYKAAFLGFSISNHDITFYPRERGESKVTFFKTVSEIGSKALITKLKSIPPHHIAHKTNGNMEGTGIRFNKKKYLTHTTLPHYLSAITTFHINQKIIIFFLFLWIIIGIIFQPLNTLLLLVGILSFIYFIDVLFNLYLVWKSLNSADVFTFTKKELLDLKKSELPFYTILCPLYKEGHVIPQFVKAMSRLDWPKDKLDVILLLEEDDTVSIDYVKYLNLPRYYRTVVVPHSMPKTKPKACNYGLAKAKGEYLVIFDAEDIPDPMQLKKAFLGFKKAGDKTICLQAKLNYYNPHHNLLTRFFTAEYSLWFDVSLTGLQSLETSLPLGGTSNHFRVKDLLELQGWDPFNVTEDADLGIRLFKKGFKTAIIDSTTLEEANSKVGNWLRQRSRWIKGYMQTYLVHTRDLPTFSKNQGLHSLYFNLTIGGKIAFILINPILWIATISYFTLNSLVGPTIEYLYPSYVFYMAAISLVFGNFLFVYYYMIGAIKRGQWELIKYIFAIPIYWLLISTAGYIALFQLIFKPHYWEKTVHGFHLKKISSNELEIQKKKNKTTGILAVFVDPFAYNYFKKNQFRIAKLSNRIYLYKNILFNIIAKSINNIPKPARSIDESPISFYKNFFSSQLLSKFKSKTSKYFSGSVLVAAMMLANILNFIFNAYLGRELNFETLALVSLINSFLYFTTIPFAALGTTVNFRSGFLEKRHGELSSFGFLYRINKGLTLVSIISAAIWLSSAMLLISFFKLDNILPVIAFTPIWLVGFYAAAYRGFITGKLMFIATGILCLIEPIVKLFAAVIFVNLGLNDFVYLSIPMAIIGGFFASIFFIFKIRSKLINNSLQAKSHKVNDINIYIEKLGQRVNKFPFKFFFISVLSGLSTMAFLSLDVILAKSYLSPVEAGQYALVSLVGKMIFFVSTLFTVFIIPLVSRNEGAKKDSSKILWYSLGIASLLGIVGLITVGIFGNLTVPMLFGEKTQIIIPYLRDFTFAVLCFALSSIFVSYYLAKKIYSFSVSTFFLSILQVILLSISHATPQSFVLVMLFIGTANLFIVIMLHLFINKVLIIENNIKDFLGIFTNSAGTINPEKKLRILIFNWRDIRHKWAGGAEVYVHEIAKRWAAKGNDVTIFCGNDAHCPRYQVIDGVQIVRRGGFYTVYFWAFVYYMLKFRGKFDVIVDSANGIPFLTQLYAGKPVYLLIHHVHQEVFKKYLTFIKSKFALFVEGKIMPFIYKNNIIITVSDSSKKELLKLGFKNPDNISVVHPGIDNNLFFKLEKSKHPVVIYLGRIMRYKNIDVLIKAFKNVVSIIPDAKLLIAGEGESKKDLIALTEELRLTDHIQFLGKVTDSAKLLLLGTSWVSVQPSQVEGWGITVIEANASGTPVIASNVNGLRDSIVDGQTGILVQPNNVEKFSEALCTVLSDKNYRLNLSQEAYEWSKNFNWELSADKFYDLVIDNIDAQTDIGMQSDYAVQKIENI